MGTLPFTGSDFSSEDGKRGEYAERQIYVDLFRVHTPAFFFAYRGTPQVT